MGKAVVVGYILERAVELLDAELLIKAVDPDAVAHYRTADEYQDKERVIDRLDLAGLYRKLQNDIKHHGRKTDNQSRIERTQAEKYHYAQQYRVEGHHLLVVFVVTYGNVHSPEHNEQEEDAEYHIDCGVAYPRASVGQKQPVGYEKRRYAEHYQHDHTEYCVDNGRLAECPQVRDEIYHQRDRLHYGYYQSENMHRPYVGAVNRFADLVACVGLEPVQQRFFELHANYLVTIFNFKKRMEQ